MTRHLDFQEGRRLRAADLNAESDSHDADAARHAALAHLVVATNVRLVGTSVTHPTGSPSLAVVPGGPAPGLRVTLRSGSPELEVAVSGGHRAATSVTASDADVRVIGAMRIGAQTTPLPGPAPWSVRAVDVRNDDDGALLARELRVELSAPPGSPPQESRVAVGTLDAQPGFHPLFTVDAAGTVTTEGDLDVAGSVSQGEIQPDPEDPRFVELLADVVARRVQGAATTVADTVLQLAVIPDDSADFETPLDVSIRPTQGLTHWGAALETRRGGISRFRLVGVGGPAVMGTKLTIATAPVPWVPPLSTSSPGRVVVAVAAFDAQGTLHAQRVDTGLLTG